MEEQKEAVKRYEKKTKKKKNRNKWGPKIGQLARSQNINGFVGTADSFAVRNGTYHGAPQVNVGRVGRVGEQRLSDVALLAVIIGLPGVSVGFTETDRSAVDHLIRAAEQFNHRTCRPTPPGSITLSLDIDQIN